MQRSQCWCVINMSDIIYLSHLLDSTTPSYGNRSILELESKRSIACGDHSNDSFLHMPVHLGTHIDMPIHFYANGQSIKDYAADFWIFNHPLLIEIQPKENILYQEIIGKLEEILPEKKQLCDMLIVKTGMGAMRHLPIYWENNPGFSPDLYTYFKSEMPLLRVFGFDGISLTGFQNRDVGKSAHQQFLNPDAPILLLEDMNLEAVLPDTKFEKIIAVPLRLSHCDGLPCTVMGFI